MARPRRKKEPDIFGLVFPVIAFGALIIIFVPGVRQFLGALFAAVLWIAGIAIVGATAWVVLRKFRQADERELYMTVPPAEPLARAADGRVNLVDLPTRVSGPAWSLELLSRLEWKRFEDVVAANFQNPYRLSACCLVSIKLI